MDTLSIEQVVDIIRFLAEKIEEQQAYLTQLDSDIGDGDFGASLCGGFRKIRDNIESIDKGSIGAVLKECGMIITDTCGGVTGPIWGSAFREAGRYALNKETLNLLELTEMMEAVTEKIKKQGGAERGDKTLLDALIPAVEAMRAGVSENVSIDHAIARAAERATVGAENTKKIIAKKGRARYLGERTLGYPDPGAVAISLLLNMLSNKYFDAS
jgi:dihydroxyacetone kinase